MHDLHDDSPVCPADLVASLLDDCRQCYIKNWSQIRSRHVVNNLCRYTLSDWRRLLTLVACFRPSSAPPKNAFKIKMLFGLILSNVETGEKRYYYPSQNGFIFDQPLGVADEADLQRVLQYIQQVGDHAPN